MEQVESRECKGHEEHVADPPSPAFPPGCLCLTHPEWGIAAFSGSSRSDRAAMNRRSSPETRSLRRGSPSPDSVGNFGKKESQTLAW